MFPFHSAFVTVLKCLIGFIDSLMWIFIIRSMWNSVMRKIVSPWRGLLKKWRKHKNLWRPSSENWLVNSTQWSRINTCQLFNVRSVNISLPKGVVRCLLTWICCLHFDFVSIFRKHQWTMQKSMWTTNFILTSLARMEAMVCWMINISLRIVQTWFPHGFSWKHNFYTSKILNWIGGHSTL